MRKHLVCIVVGILCFTITTPSSAQPTGFAVDRFDAAEVGSDWFSGDSLDFRASTKPAAGLTIDSAKAPLVDYNAPGGKDIAVIKSQTLAHLQSRIVVEDRFRLAATLPVLMRQSREQTHVGGVLYTPGKGLHAGDLRLSGDVRLFGHYGERFNLAVGAEIYAPTGYRAAFVGDGRFRFAPRAMIAGDISQFAYSLRATVLYRRQDVGFGKVPTGNEIAFVATAGMRFLHRRLLVGPEFWAATGLSAGSVLKIETTPIELLFGGHYSLGPLRIGFGIGPGLSHGLGSPRYRVLASVAYVAEVNTDVDGDGFLDGDDECLYAAGVAHGVGGRRGCPADTDNDGVIDELDACPSIRGVTDDHPEGVGCPSDRDRDGLIDEQDACPYDAGVASDDATKNGCKVDRDEDGIQDDMDACPDAPGVADDDPTKYGCPSDRDGDGIIDEEDPCPELPGRCERN